MKNNDTIYVLHVVCVINIHNKYSDTCERQDKDIQIKPQGSNLSKIYSFSWIQVTPDP